MAIRLPGSARQLLRDAIRRHPNVGPTMATLYPGKKVNDLIRPELIHVAQDLKVDIATILATAAAQDRGTAPPAFRPVPTPVGQDVGRDVGRDVGTQDEDHDMLDPHAEQEATAEEKDEDEASENASDTERALVEETETIRRTIAAGMVAGDFATVTDTIKALVREAHKPAEVIVIREGATHGAAAPVALPVPKPIGVKSRQALFGFRGKAGADMLNVFAPHPTTPAVDTAYEWPQDATEAVLSAMKRKRNIWLFGPAGTGKSTFAEQMAARTGRPFYLIACDDTTEAPELVGMTTPHDGSTRWQDGVLTAAIRVPNAVVLIDEPSVARPGALMVLQSVLASRLLSIKETGEMVHVADGVHFICADNTNGTGGGNAAGYEGTRRLNRATLDRFSAFVGIDYMAPDVEARVLTARSGCTPELAKLLVECAGLTRAAKVTHALGLRRLIAWAELLTDGIAPRRAFEYAILNSATKDDREPLEQCCALGLKASDVAAALAGKPGSNANPLDFGA